MGLRRAVGKVVRLSEKLSVRAVRRQAPGVAHSRWATHGGVTEANAHPHVSGSRIAVIHNGIIENYVAIRKALTRQGLCLHLRDRYRGHRPPDPRSRVGRARTLTAAVQAAARIHTAPTRSWSWTRRQPDRLVVARIASPLVVGLGEGENLRRLRRAGAAAGDAPLPVPRRRRGRRRAACGRHHLRCRGSSWSSGRCMSPRCPPMRLERGE